MARLIVDSIIADALPPRKSPVQMTPIDIPDAVCVPPPVPDLKAFFSVRGPLPQHLPIELRDLYREDQVSLSCGAHALNSLLGYCFCTGPQINAFRSFLRDSFPSPCLPSF